MMSLAPHGMPCSGPLYLPAAISASARFASAHPDVVEERDDVVQLGVVAVQPREVHLGQLDRRDLPGAQELGEMADRPERDVFEIRGTLHRRRGAEAERQLRPVHLDARHERAEVKRRRDVVGDVDRAHLLVAREVLVRGVDHRLQLGLGELEAGQLHRVGDHRERDLLLARVLHAGPQDAGRERASRDRCSRSAS